MRRPPVWVRGMYQRASNTVNKQVLFFRVPKRDAVTPLQDGDIDEFLPNFEAHNQVNFDQNEAKFRL
jgi:hypothetical protein